MSQPRRPWPSRPGTASAHKLIVGHKLAPALDIAGHDKHTNGGFCCPSNCAFDPERSDAGRESRRSATRGQGRQRRRGSDGGVLPPLGSHAKCFWVRSVVGVQANLVIDQDRRNNSANPRIAISEYERSIKGGRNNNEDSVSSDQELPHPK